MRLTEADLREIDSVLKECDGLLREDKIVAMLVAEVRRLRGLIAAHTPTGSFAAPEIDGCLWCFEPFTRAECQHKPDCGWLVLDAEARAIREETP